MNISETSGQVNKLYLQSLLTRQPHQPVNSKSNHILNFDFELVCLWEDIPSFRRGLGGGLQVHLQYYELKTKIYSHHTLQTTSRQPKDLEAQRQLVWTHCHSEHL